MSLFNKLDHFITMQKVFTPMLYKTVLTEQVSNFGTF
jgi:hypothetical protein